MSLDTTHTHTQRHTHSRYYYTHHRLTNAPGIMDKRLSGLVSRWHGTANCKFQSFNNGGFATTIGSDNDRTRKIKFQDLFIVVGTEGSNATNRKLVDGCHC